MVLEECQYRIPAIIYVLVLFTKYNTGIADAVGSLVTICKYLPTSKYNWAGFDCISVPGSRIEGNIYIPFFWSNTASGWKIK